MEHFDIAIIGAGLAGNIAAIALARGGRKVVLVAPKPTNPDRRTTALMDQSIRYIDTLGLWDALRPASAALSTMRIIDGTRRLLRAPTVTFQSSEIDIEAFGHNFPNQAFLDVLEPATRREPNITVIDFAAETIAITDEVVTVTTADGGTLSADFVVGADGRKSMTRENAGVGVHTWSYPQTAVVLNFSHTLPHRNVSTEFHTDQGPFTQVPLPGDRSSLVWVVESAEAARLTTLPIAELSRTVEARMSSLLGKVTVEDGVQTWPLSGMTAKRYGKGRAAFIGEAGHAFPPIGAQGLNLSLRDVMALEDLLCRTNAPIDAHAGDAFDRKRRADVWSRTASVDLLNRSLLSPLLPVQMVRAAGLHVLATIPPLRHLVMQEGVAPGFALSSLPSRLREKIRRQQA